LMSLTCILRLPTSFACLVKCIGGTIQYQALKTAPLLAASKVEDAITRT
jgi:hypothetical protein